MSYGNGLKGKTAFTIVFDRCVMEAAARGAFDARFTEAVARAERAEADLIGLKEINSSLEERCAFLEAAALENGIDVKKIKRSADLVSVAKKALARSGST